MSKEPRIVDSCRKERYREIFPLVKWPSPFDLGLSSSAPDRLAMEKYLTRSPAKKGAPRKWSRSAQGREAECYRSGTVNGCSPKLFSSVNWKLSTSWKIQVIFKVFGPSVNFFSQYWKFGIGGPGGGGGGGGVSWNQCGCTVFQKIFPRSR